MHMHIDRWNTAGSPEIHGYRDTTHSLDFQQKCKEIFSGEIIVFFKNSAGTIRHSYAKT